MCREIDAVMVKKKVEEEEKLKKRAAEVSGEWAVFHYRLQSCVFCEGSNESQSIGHDKIKKAQEDARREAEEEDDYDIAAPFDLTGMQAGDEMGDDYEDDVDGIVDPLAGLRGAEDDLPVVEGDAGEDTLDLTGDYADYEEDDAPAAPPPVAAQDDLLASADRLAAEDQPVTARLGGGRRRGLLGEGSGEGGAASGSTLFERMANLSRSTGRDEEEEEDEGEDGPALSIPRFLDRNRNQ